MIGLGSRSGAEVAPAVSAALDAVGLRTEQVAVLATVDRRAAGVRDLAVSYGWRLAVFSAAELAAQPVPRPSAAVAELVGTPSVAEAAALLAAGPDGRLVREKQVYAMVTVAIAYTPSALPAGQEGSDGWGC